MTTPPHVAWKGQLWAPKAYWLLTQVQHNNQCNGCGAAGAALDFVPDTMYGLSVTQCCNIHDYMYGTGKTEKARYEADTSFLVNCLRLIEAKGGWLMMPRCYRAVTYYLAVRKKGGAAFARRK